MRRLVARARVGRLASVDGEGHPHLVPFCFVLDGDTLYSEVDDKPKSSRHLKRIRNIQGDPRVSVLVDHYEDDWPKVWWVRLDGRGRVVEPGAERERALSLLGEKYPQYRQQDEPGLVLAVDVERWRGWSYT